MYPETAVRKFSLVNEGQSSEVTVRLFHPEPYPDHSGYQCRVKVEWPSKTQDLHVGGVDAIQAVILALQTLGAIINTSEEAKEGRLVWFEQGSGFGLPVSKGIGDLLQGEDKNL